MKNIVRKISGIKDIEKEKFNTTKAADLFTTKNRKAFIQLEDESKHCLTDNIKTIQTIKSSNILINSKTGNEAELDFTRLENRLVTDEENIDNNTKLIEQHSIKLEKIKPLIHDEKTISLDGFKTNNFKITRTIFTVSNEENIFSYNAFIKISIDFLKVEEVGYFNSKEYEFNKYLSFNSQNVDSTIYEDTIKNEENEKLLMNIKIYHEKNGNNHDYKIDCEFKDLTDDPYLTSHITDGNTYVNVNLYGFKQ